MELKEGTLDLMISALKADLSPMQRIIVTRAVNMIGNKLFFDINKTISKFNNE